MSDDEFLDGLADTLHEIETLIALGRTEYDANRLLRWSVHRLWIFAGNSAQVHAERHGIPCSTWPWSDLIGFRGIIAHWTPAQVNDERVWDETVRDLPEIIEALGRPRRE